MIHEAHEEHEERNREERKDHEEGLLDFDFHASSRIIHPSVLCAAALKTSRFSYELHELHE